MFYYGYISKFSQNHDPGIINKYLDHSIENNFEIKKFYTETNFLTDEQFEQCEFNSLLNRIEIQNTTIIQQGGSITQDDINNILTSYNPANLGITTISGDLIVTGDTSLNELDISNITANILTLNEGIIIT